MFDESPVEREDYSKITGSDIFPLPFYGHKWLEDKSVAERALQIWPQIAAFTSETLKKPRSQLPTSNTFSTVRSAVQDSFKTAKLEFFVSVAAIPKPYLEIFDSDAPLPPFITLELPSNAGNSDGEFFKETGT